LFVYLPVSISTTCYSDKDETYCDSNVGSNRSALSVHCATQ